MGPCMISRKDAEVTWFTNGNSLIQDGQRYAGAVVDSNTKIIWAELILEGTSDQKAELAALTKAIELRKDKRHR
jgi:ribonuclease HI